MMVLKQAGNISCRLTFTCEITTIQPYTKKREWNYDETAIMSNITSRTPLLIGCRANREMDHGNFKR